MRVKYLAALTILAGLTSPVSLATPPPEVSPRYCSRSICVFSGGPSFDKSAVVTYRRGGETILLKKEDRTEIAFAAKSLLDRSGTNKRIQYLQRNFDDAWHIQSSDTAVAILCIGCENPNEFVPMVVAMVIKATDKRSLASYMRSMSRVWAANHTSDGSSKYLDRGGYPVSHMKIALDRPRDIRPKE